MDLPCHPPPPRWGDFDEYIPRIDIMEITVESPNLKAYMNQCLFQEMKSKRTYLSLEKEKGKMEILL